MGSLEIVRLLVLRCEVCDVERAGDFAVVEGKVDGDDGEHDVLAVQTLSHRQCEQFLVRHLPLGGAEEKKS